MQALVALLAIGAVMAVTYLVFRILGPRRSSLLLSEDEKQRWDTTVVPKLGRPLVIASLVGTLTSLATAYVFFIGTSKIFGYWIMMCPVSIFLGAFVSNFVTRAVLQDSRLRERVTGGSQQSGVIARLFWSADASGISTARTVKWISAVAIAGVVWLEFALFSDILGLLLQLDSLLVKALICAIATFVVAHFTLRYGLRGFVFADAFHAPLIVLATLTIVFATAVRYFSSSSQPVTTNEVLELATPIVSTLDGILFVVHVLILNAFLVVFREAHWLRLWFLTKEPVLRAQVAGAGATAAIWLLLSICGFLTFAITGSVGEEAIVKLLSAFAVGSHVVPSLFWLGAAAALFSTADTQIYGLLLLGHFDPRTGTINDMRFASMQPAKIAVVFGLIFFLLYFVARYFSLPFEKFIFIIIPFSLNLMPGFTALLTGRQPRATLILVSLVGYLLFAVLGFVQPENQFTMTLLASVVPVAVSACVFLTRKSNNGAQ